MKKLVLLWIGSLFISAGLQAQAREPSRKEKKAQAWLENKDKLLDLAKDTTLVLEANTY